MYTYCIILTTCTLTYTFYAYEAAVKWYMTGEPLPSDASCDSSARSSIEREWGGGARCVHVCLHSAHSPEWIVGMVHFLQTKDTSDSFYTSRISISEAAKRGTTFWGHFKTSVRLPYQLRTADNFLLGPYFGWQSEVLIARCWNISSRLCGKEKYLLLSLDVRTLSRPQNPKSNPFPNCKPNWTVQSGPQKIEKWRVNKR